MKLISRMRGIHPVAGNMGGLSRSDMVVIGKAGSRIVPRNEHGILVWLAV